MADDMIKQRALVNTSMNFPSSIKWA